MECFNEYLEKHSRETKKKLEDILDLLKRVDEIKPLGYLDQDNPYIFIRIQQDKNINQNLSILDLGVRIYSIGNKLTYRLQRGPKGIQIGPARIIEDPEEIEDLLTQGKTEQEAYNEIFRQIPKKIKHFIKKVYENINNKFKEKISVDTDSEKYNQILNSILTAKTNQSFKM